MTPYDNDIDQLLTQAEAFLQEDKPMEALALLERARKIQPGHAWMLLFRGVALGQLGRVDEAITDLIASADKNVGDIDIQVDAARHLASLDQYQDALVCAQRAIALDANDAGANAIFGEALEHLGRVPEAVNYRELAVSLDPSDIDSRYYLAVNLCDVGRFDEAFVVSKALLDEMPDDADILRLYGACLSYLGRHQEALGVWAKLERLEGINPNLLHNRASTLDALELHDEALATINEAIDIEPDLGINYFTRALFHEHNANDEAAIDDYLTSLTLDPDYLDAVINLIELATVTNKVDKVLQRVEELLLATPESAKLLYAKGRLFMEMEKPAEGTEYIEAAVRREPAFGIGWYTLTMMYVMTGNLESAVTASDHALRYFPDDAGLWFNRGLALHDLHRYPEAVASYDKAANLAPDDPMAWIQLGRVMLLDLDRPADAQGVFREVLRLQPGMPSALWMLALACLRLKKYDEASGIIAKLLETIPDHLWGHLVRAALHAQQQNFDAAFADLHIAAEEGYDTRLLLNEPLFEPLWTDPRFDVFLKGESVH